MGGNSGREPSSFESARTRLASALGSMINSPKPVRSIWTVVVVNIQALGRRIACELPDLNTLAVTVSMA